MNGNKIHHASAGLGLFTDRNDNSWFVAKWEIGQKTASWEITPDKSASDDVCFGVNRDKLSGWLILDPLYRAFCVAVETLPCSDHDAQALSAAKTSIKEGTQMRPSRV